jgi:hypothetical protein
MGPIPEADAHRWGVASHQPPPSATAYCSPLAASAPPGALALLQMHIEFDLSGLQTISEVSAFLRIGASIEGLPERIDFLKERNLRRNAPRIAKQ